MFIYTFIIKDTPPFVNPVSVNIHKILHKCTSNVKNVKNL